MSGGPPVRLDAYSISLFLEGSVEETPDFGIGSLRTIPRERPSTMMRRRSVARGLSHLAFLGPWDRVSHIVHETTYEADDNGK